ncbi:MAG: [FeFe] hydrogenase H-cluster maturation GTPase HydF [Eubacteriales bacterium]|nr:[FeFe] hydrogenase H-cluster maturation GTPase HydF [Eubacteriales bacterium]
MSLNSTSSAERVHIGFFGLRNSGKSSLVNAITNQKISVVSSIKGTTTDSVQKSMEILPLGPVVIIDTPGMDDKGELGKLRVESAKRVLSKTDIAVLVVDATKGMVKLDEDIVKIFSERAIPYIVAMNKCDLLNSVPDEEDNTIYVSAEKKYNINALKEKIASIAKPRANTKRIVGDILQENDVVVLVTPIDASAPKGRLILPQQATIRDILDSKAVAITVQPQQLDSVIKKIKGIRLVITDSQAFATVNAIVPPSIALTSFSMLFARFKGDINIFASGASQLDSLKDGDTVLISEGCTHHRQCEDIGTVKLPAWINKYTQKHLNFCFTSGGDFPSELSNISLVIHCGGCMLNEREIASRMESAKKFNVPITNYGVAIAYMQGILQRTLSLFKI